MKETSSQILGNGAWTFGYPQCINKKQSRLVCLHKNCEKFPFFCSSCQDQSCQKEHQHQDRITSIGFKELVRKLISDRKVPQAMQDSTKKYKQKLQELKANVIKFVQNQIKSVDQLLKKQMQLEPQQQGVIAKLKDKKYQEIKGKQLDKVWKKVVPTQQSKKREKQTIQFINSKKVEVEQLNQQFQGMLATTQNQDKGKIPVQSNIKAPPK